MGTYFWTGRIYASFGLFWLQINVPDTVLSYFVFLYRTEIQSNRMPISRLVSYITAPENKLQGRCQIVK